MLGYIFDGGSLGSGDPGKYILVHPGQATTAEHEGGDPGLTFDATKRVAVGFLGPGPAMAGYWVTAHQTGGRWMAMLGYGRIADGYETPACPCRVTPRTLYMTVNDPTLDNFLFQDCTIALQAKPAWTLPLPLPDPMYLSPELTSQDVGPNNGAKFHYSFDCYQGFYVLFRLFPTSTFGSPYREAVRYQWVIGFDGATCVPFDLPQGIGFAGMDPGLIVSING